LKPTIAIYVQHPYASSQCANGVMKALDGEFRFKLFTKHEQLEGFFDDVDMFCFPGGIGDAAKFDSIHPSTIDAVKWHTNKGTPYLGICMGAYWAGSDYFDIIGSTHAEQYITRPNTDTKRPHAKAMNVTWNGEQMKMFFYDGCALFGGEYETIATYPNGDAMAIKKGNIGLIGCHPEAEKDWYDMYSWMKKQWTGNQHQLLLDFAKHLNKK